VNTPPAALQDLAAALDTWRLVADSRGTPTDAAEYVAAWLAGAGWCIRPDLTAAPAEEAA